MALRPTTFASLFAHSSPILRRPAATPFALHPARFASSPLRLFHTPSRPVALARSVPASKAQPSRYGLYAVLSLGLGTAYWTQLQNRKPLACASPLGDPRPRPEVGGGQPTSEFSAYELTFGAVCGICSGVFIKKGLRAIAFMLGGVFLLLQYLSSKSFISVDWGKVAGRYDSAFGTKTTDGKIRPPSVGGVWAWFVDFLTANFQQRASFLAGLVLGLRLG